VVLTVILPIIIRTRTRPVMFSKYSGIGDIVCTFPAALELKKRHPKATFIYNCHADYAACPEWAAWPLSDDVGTGRPDRILVSFLLSGFCAFASDDDNANHTPTEVYIKDFGRPFGLVLDDAIPG